MTTNYYWNGTQFLGEESAGNVTMYIYDAYGSPIGFQYRNATYTNDLWDIFWYEKNLQGDIVGVYNSAGVKLISYKYDAWGNTTTTYHNGTTAASVQANQSWNTYARRFIGAIFP